MLRKTKTVVVTLLIVGLVAVVARSVPAVDAKSSHGGFTGDVKLVFYVQDVRQAVAFYTDALGFRFHHFYDGKTGGSVSNWTRDTPPIYAEMSFAGRRFGIHSPTSKADQKSIGGAKIYFRVKDLNAHHLRTTEWGANPSDIKRPSWMDMFHVVDSDGNRVYFAFTDDKVHGNPWTGS